MCRSNIISHSPPIQTLPMFMQDKGSEDEPKEEEEQMKERFDIDVFLRDYIFKPASFWVSLWNVFYGFLVLFSVQQDFFILAYRGRTLEDPSIKSMQSIFSGCMILGVIAPFFIAYEKTM